MSGRQSRSERYFVDTNLLVYARDASETEKQPCAHAWLEYLWLSRAGRLSVQVLQEYYQTVTRKLSPGLDRVTARDDVRDLLSWQPVNVDAAVIEKAWAAEERFGLSWWDSLIVGAAQHAGCRFLLTEDLQDGQDLDGMVVLDPFTTRAPRPAAPGD